MTTPARLSLVAAALVTLVPTAPSPGASILTGNIPQAGDQNVLFNGTGLTAAGTTVQGWTNQDHYVVDFSSTTSLSTPAQGQAKIVANTASTFADLSIALHDSAETFDSLIFNLSAARTGTAEFTVFGAGNSTLAHSTVSLSQNGSNWFTILAGSTESITRVLISRASSAGISTGRQFRIGGIEIHTIAPPDDPILNFHPNSPQSPGGPVSLAAVPLPTAAWGGSALLAAYGLARQRRAAAAARSDLK